VEVRLRQHKKVVVLMVSILQAMEPLELPILVAAGVELVTDQFQGRVAQAAPVSLS
jgi:hypothetical protein